jgi:hypothetical protein
LVDQRIGGDRFRLINDQQRAKAWGSLDDAGKIRSGNRPIQCLNRGVDRRVDRIRELNGQGAVADG